jgi:hypothetical protein
MQFSGILEMRKPSFGSLAEYLLKIPTGTGTPIRNANTAFARIHACPFGFLIILSF